jgi:Cu-Zn family superoxide dismutase
MERFGQRRLACKKENDMTKVARSGLFVLGAAAIVSACAQPAPREEPPPSPSPPPRAQQASAVIEARSDSQLSGMATFTVEGEQIAMRLDLEHAPPGRHAAHIHEFGDCSAPDGSSAGGHWNPMGVDHGKWAVEPFHLGDLGNVTIGADGSGAFLLTTDLWSIGTGESNDIVGKAIIVHAGVDDFSTQPTGGAGGRIGCGVIVKEGE